MKSLPLKTLWQSLGATFREDDGREIIAHFGNTQNEYAALKKAVGLYDDSFRGKIRVSGEDAVPFLHRMLSQDIKNLKNDAGCDAALLSATGKVLSFMKVYRADKVIWLLTDPGVERKTIELLNRFIITEDVRLDDASSEQVMLSCLGDKAHDFFSAVAAADAVRFADTHQWLLPRDRASDFARKILETGQSFGLTPVGGDAYEILRIESGTPRYGVDITEEMTLPETGLEKIAASETKGCYPGQEVVARTLTYGGPKRKVQQLTLEEGSVPVPGDAVFLGDQKAGAITSACFSLTKKKPVAIAFLTLPVKDIALSLIVKTGSENLQAKIV